MPDYSQFRVLYEDNHVIACFKPAGLLSQGDRTGDPSVLDLAKDYIKKTYQKPGNVFLGLVHRLDRPVSGVMVLARTSKAASRLTREFSQRRAEKTYIAVVQGHPESPTGRLEARIARDEQRAYIPVQPGPDAKPAVLRYHVVARSPGLALLEVVPETGRHHQIRVQLASEGTPIVGDVKYGAPDALPDRSIGLHAARIAVQHPTRDEKVIVTAPPPAEVPWKRFYATIENRYR